MPHLAATKYVPSAALEGIVSVAFQSPEPSSDPAAVAIETPEDDVNETSALEPSVPFASGHGVTEVAPIDEPDGAVAGENASDPGAAGASATTRKLKVSATITSPEPSTRDANRFADPTDRKRGLRRSAGQQLEDPIVTRVGHEHVAQAVDRHPGRLLQPAERQRDLCRPAARQLEHLAVIGDEHVKRPVDRDSVRMAHPVKGNTVCPGNPTTSLTIRLLPASATYRKPGLVNSESRSKASPVGELSR